ncbi:MAG: hypothetical protein AAF611_20335 [Bacteroidota bacterium]
MKKILGFLLFFVGGYLILSMILKLFGVAEEVKEKTQAEIDDPESFALGVTIGTILLTIVALVAIFFGYKLLKSASKEDAQKKLPKDSKEK